MNRRRGFAAPCCYFITTLKRLIEKNPEDFPVSKQTPLYDRHIAAGAKMVDFAGWSMPVNYGSQIEEHHIVRRDAGMFDVSHMLALDLSGADATIYLRALLANDVAKLGKPGKALYSCMLNDRGGVIDDLIVYRFSDTDYRIVVNAGTADKDVAWMRRRIAVTGVNVTLEARHDLAMLAVQGPAAIERCRQAIPELAGMEIPEPFCGVRAAGMMIARTGYTGEDGLEITLPAQRAPALWDALLAAGVRPAGLGARDTLRLEAGMNLYGQDMDDDISPLDAGLGWTIDLNDESRDFVGKKALLANPARQRLAGIILDEKGILRAHMKVYSAEGEGEISSGTFSPTLERSIAMARLPLGIMPGDGVEIDVRGKRLKGHTVKLPFVRNGKILV